jgi:hypothetical protein
MNTFEVRNRPQKSLDVTSEHLKNAFLLKPIDLVASISIDNIALLITLKVPRCDEDCVPDSHPHSLLHSTRNSTYTNVLILTSDSNSIETQHLDYYSKHLSIITSGGSDSEWFVGVIILLRSFAASFSWGQKIPPVLR